MRVVRFCFAPLVATLCCLAWAGTVSAEEVSLVGVFPGKALVVIDGGAPRALAPGQTLGSVKVISVERDSALSRMPADFLIDAAGTIRVAYYGKDMGDHLSFDAVEAFVANHSKLPTTIPAA